MEIARAAFVLYRPWSEAWSTWHPRSPRRALGMALFFLVIHGEKGFRSANHRQMLLDPGQQLAIIRWRKLFDVSMRCVA
ncbi:MAG: hypothetical protein PHD76_03620 [Methylacidiphilales bacterium]|nr:hypothetical protein [Candidatus Methylacidiphilales bacterium]